LKLLLSGYAVKSFNAMQQWGLMHQLCPQLKADKSHQVIVGAVLKQALINTDERISQGKPVTPAFLFAALLWEPLSQRAQAYQDKGYAPQDALIIAGDEVVAKQCRTTAIPRRFSAVTRAIWSMQPRFEKMRGSRAWRLLNERKFRAAYDFLILRSLEDESLLPQLEWWTEIQTLSPDEQQERIFGSGTTGKNRRRPRQRKSVKSNDSGSE